MSCVPESTWSVYVDGELPPERVREVEGHLVGCERCRRVVLALRAETHLLSDVLRERPATFREPLVETDARGLLTGMPVTLAALGLVVAVVGVILETRLPTGADWLTPQRLFGVNEMLFDLFFAVRDRAPGWVEFGAAVAVTASAAALVTFVAGALLRRVSGPLALGLVAALVWPWASPSQAALRMVDQQEVRVAEGETFQGTLVASAEEVRIDGVLDGSAVVFAERLSIDGEVRGNVLAFVREIDLTGRVTGSLLAGTENLRLEGEVAGETIVGVDRMTLISDGRIGGDLAVFGETAVVEGEVGRDLLGFVQRLELRGGVARDVEIYADDVSVLGSARVGRDLRAHVEDADAVEVSADARIGGTSETLLVEHGHEGWASHYGRPGFYLFVGVRIIAAFLVGMGLYALFPRMFAQALPDGSRFFAALGLGFAAALLAPVALVLVGLTIVGLPAALLGLALFLASLYVAGIRVAALVGTALVPPADAGLRAFGLALLVGLAVLAVATHLPFVGGVVRVVVVLVGLGLLVRHAQEAWRRRAPARP